MTDIGKIAFATLAAMLVVIVPSCKRKVSAAIYVVGFWMMGLIATIMAMGFYLERDPWYVLAAAAHIACATAIGFFIGSHLRE